MKEGCKVFLNRIVVVTIDTRCVLLLCGFIYILFIIIHVVTNH